MMLLLWDGAEDFWERLRAAGFGSEAVAPGQKQTVEQEFTVFTMSLLYHNGCKILQEILQEEDVGLQP